MVVFVVEGPRPSMREAPAGCVACRGELHIGKHDATLE
jgi:hypothetical protein